MMTTTSSRNVLTTKTTKKKKRGRSRSAATLAFALFFFFEALGALTRGCDGAGYYAYDEKKQSNSNQKLACGYGSSGQGTDDPRNCFATCDSCDGCQTFAYDLSDKECKFLNHESYSKTTSDSSFEWYVPVNPLTDADFKTHVAGCLAEAPETGLCKQYGGRNFDGYIGYQIGSMPDWDVSAVTDMEEAFKDKDTFNADLSSWDVSSVTNMYAMFYGASKFNQDISNWDVSQVTNMNRMFYQVYDFNADISNWNVSQVMDMNRMF